MKSKNISYVVINNKQILSFNLIYQKYLPVIPIYKTKLNSYN